MGKDTSRDRPAIVECREDELAEAIRSAVLDFSEDYLEGGRELSRHEASWIASETLARLRLVDQEKTSLSKAEPSSALRPSRL